MIASFISPTYTFKNEKAYKDVHIYMLRNKYTYAYICAVYEIKRYQS